MTAASCPSPGPAGSTVTNNLVYDNAAAGLLVAGASGTALVNNTVYQPDSGDAVRVEGSAAGTRLANNVLVAGAGYALSVAADSQSGFGSDFNDFVVSGGGKLALWQNAARPTLAAWRNAAFFDLNSIAQDPAFVDPDGGDNKLGVVGGTDYGRDDDFHVRSDQTLGVFKGGSLAPALGADGLPEPVPGTPTTFALRSPTLDRGDPASAYADEPAPNGGYVDLGAYGNTAQTSRSPAQYVLVTSPDGGEVWPAKQTFPVRWRADNFGGVNALDFDGVDDEVRTPYHSALAVGLGESLTLEAWVRPDDFGGHPYLLVRGDDTFRENYGLAFNYGADNPGRLVFFYDTADGLRQQYLMTDATVPAGAWSHLAVTFTFGTAASARMYLNGQLVAGSWVGGTGAAAPAASTGPLVIGRHRSYNPSADFAYDGRVDEVRVWRTARTQAQIQAAMNATLAGSEAGLAAYYKFDAGSGTTATDGGPNGLHGALNGGPAWVASAAVLSKVNVELVRAGTVVSAIAAGTPNDGEFVWSIPAGTPAAADYNVRVTRTDGAMPADTSNGPFQITPPVSVYYVNDGTVNAGDWTTAAGDDGNDGLTPATPKATLRALLEAYDLEAGAVVKVDAGAYLLSSNVTLTDNDSGEAGNVVTILGNAEGGRETVLDRGNTAGGAYAVELAGADDVTLRDLVLTGGQYGLYAGSSADGDGIRVEGGGARGNSAWGVYVEAGNDAFTVTGARFEGNGFYSNAVGTQVLNSTFAGGSVQVYGAGTLVKDNEVWGAGGDGITAGYGSFGADPLALPAAERITVESNRAHDNAGAGVAASSAVLVRNNTLYRNATGAAVAYGAAADGNEAFDNVTGIRLDSYFGYAAAVNNRAYRNAAAGVSLVGGGVVRGNALYANGVGVDGPSTSSRAAVIEGNLVYANANAGIRLGGYFGTVSGNTVRQPVGDAVRVEGGSRNVTLRDNVLTAGGAAAAVLSVAADSQLGFASDYNLIFPAGGGAAVARWEGADFPTLADWQYAVGQDGHSRQVDPRLVDPDGADNVEGFGAAPVAGAGVVKDDGAAALTGAWEAAAGGVGGTHRRVAMEYGQYPPSTATATWSFPVTAGEWYEVAVSWPAGPDLTYRAPFGVYDGPARAGYAEFDQRSAPDDYTADGVAWERLGTFYAGSGTLSVRVENGGLYYVGGLVAADAVRVVRLVGNKAADDRFGLQGTSPAVDAGDPASDFINEPLPNGGRRDLGHTGNTASATASPAKLVQVLSPNGTEKFRVGQPTTVTFHTSGLAANRPVALVDAGGSGGGLFAPDRYRTGGGGNGSFAEPVDRSGVTDPAPEGVYQTYAYGYDGAAALAYHVPVPDGTYTLRLHFAEPDLSYAGGRLFDIVVNGATLADDFDIYAAAGARYKAVARAFTVTAAGGAGVSFRLPPSGAYGQAVLSAFDLLAADPGGAANPTVKVDYSADGGATWAAVAAGVPLDRYGNGSVAWTPAAATDRGRFRVTAEGGASPPSDTSDLNFQVAPATTRFYVSPAGDDANSGATAAAPVKSVGLLLRAYHLNPGDVIELAAGTHRVYQNLVFGPDDSGVRLEAAAGATPVLDRGNTNSQRYLVELAGGDDVTLAGLVLTGGQYGVYAGADAGSDRFALAGGTVRDNGAGGVWVEYGNPGLTVAGVRFENDGLYAAGADARVLDSTLVGGWVSVSGARAVVRNVEVSGADYGIQAYGPGLSEADRIIVENSRAHDNGQYGVYAGYGVVVRNNRAYRNGTGVWVGYGAVARGNEAWENTTGVYAYYGGVADGNRAYHNAGAGVYLDGYYSGSAAARNNVAYANSVGIEAHAAYYGADISNNIVYANTNLGIRVSGGNAVRVVNNTAYQPVGDAVRVEGGSQGTFLRNNLLWTEAGYDIYVAADSTAGFASDYNDLHQGPAANAYLGYWAGATHDTLAAWRAATGGDARSFAASPQFLDPDGVDNVLGYSTAGGGYDGGRDDNFYQARASVLIDSGDPWAAPATDITGQARRNDPGVPNRSPDYAETALGSSGFAAGGTAQGWRSTNTYWGLNLAFAFPFYGDSYTGLWVSTEGFLGFDTGVMYDETNSTAELRARRLIAPLWDNLRTDGTGDDIFVDTSVADRVTVRWNATDETTGGDVNFAVTLYSTGEIRFHYGSGNAGLTPTVGVGRGDGRFAVVSAYDGRASLAGANSVKIAADDAAGFADIGAYEFRGDSSDSTPPQLLAVTPGGVAANGTVGERLTRLALDFSEPLNPIDANSPAAYDLRAAGPDRAFDTGDDVVYALAPGYVAGSTRVTLDIPGAGLRLPGGDYQFTVFGTAARSLFDLAGNRLDGNGNGGADAQDSYVRVFAVAAPAVVVTPATGLATTEAGGTATFTVVLAAQPTADVTVSLASSDPTEGTASASTLVFTPDNWNVPRTVTVTGVDDAEDDGDIGYAIVTAAASTDAAYDGLAVPDVGVTNADNDVAGVTVTPTSGLVTTEAGGTATFTVRLASKPTADVTIAVSSGDASEGAASPASLVFTAANWATPQTVTVTGANDPEDDGDVAYTVVTGAAASADGKYNGLAVADVAVTNTDDDTAGVAVTPTAGLVTTEAGGTATFTVALLSRPTANVTIPLSSSNTAEGTVAPASLTFTPANWDAPQTVTVTGVNDPAVDGDIGYTVVTGAAASADGKYDGLAVADVAVTNRDDDQGEVTDIKVLSAVLNGTSGLTVRYAVVGKAADPFALGFYRSADGAYDPADAALLSVDLTAAGDLAVGEHTKTFAVGLGAGQVPLPGLGAVADPGEDYALLAVADPANAVGEDDADPTAEDNTARLTGAYTAPGKPAFVHGTDGADAVTVRTAGATLEVVLNGTTYSYPLKTTPAVRVRAGAGADAVSAAGTSKPLAAWGGAGADRLEGGTGSDLLDGGAGADAVVAAGDKSFTLTDLKLTGLGTDTLFGIERAELTGGPGANTFSLAGWTGAAAVDGGGGTDGLVGPAGGGAWRLTGAGAGDVNAGAVTFARVENLTGGGGVDVFEIADGAAFGAVSGGGGTADVLSYAGWAAAVAVDLGAKAAPGVGTFSAFEAVVGGAAADTLIGTDLGNGFAVTGADRGRAGKTLGFEGFEHLRGGAGADTLSVGVGGSLSGGFDGRGGADAVVGPNAATAWALTGAGAGNLNGGAVAFTNVEGVTGGAGADTFAVGAGAGGFGQVSGGAHPKGLADTLSYAAWATAVTVDLGAGPSTAAADVVGFESVVGGSAGDTLAGTDAATLWLITGAGAGKAGAVAFEAFENLRGGAGADTFRLAPAGSVAGGVVGGGGVDALDYALHLSGVAVDLGAGTATGIGGAVSGVEDVVGGAGADTLAGDGADNRLAGGGGNDTLSGGGGADALVGGAGNDSLLGGDGPDVLIGGAGVDRLFAGPGGGILIGGTTSYDANAAALYAVRAEWAGPSPYADRVAHLRGTLAGGLNGSFVLTAATVKDDKAADVLDGGLGVLDWFFLPPLDAASTAGTPGREPGEEVN